MSFLARRLSPSLFNPLRTARLFHSTPIMAANPQFLKYVDDHQADFINRLKEAVEIPS